MVALMPRDFYQEKQAERQSAHYKVEDRKMLFPRIDVREGLLCNNYNRGARRAEEIEIDLSTATSAEARRLLERGHGQARVYMVDTARRFYCDAAELARKHRDGFIEAAAGMLQTILMDGMTNSNSQPHFLEGALEALDYELYGLRERLTEARAPRDQAIPIMNPRIALRDLIEENLSQYRFRQDSLLLAETMTNANRQLAAGNWFAAESVSRIGSENATATFGADHWWNAVMLVRQATALLRQQQVERAKPLLQKAAFVFAEWSDFADNGGVFKQELDILRVAQSDVAIVSA